MMDYFDGTTGEVKTPAKVDDMSHAVRLAQAEMEMDIAMAIRHPRDMLAVADKIRKWALADEEAAEDCMFSLPRDGKAIMGPSIGMAQIVASAYGNCTCARRIVAIDRVEKVVVAEGGFYDRETGLKTVIQVRRRISTKSGGIFSDDMITVTGNAAASIAIREAILRSVPAFIWKRTYDECERRTVGNVKNLGERRQKAVKAFAAYGAKPDDILAYFHIKSMDEVGISEILALTGIFQQIKSGEAEVESFFPNLANEGGKAAARDPVKPPAQVESKPVKPKAEAKPKPAEVEVAQEVVNDPEPEQEPVEEQVQEQLAEPEPEVKAGKPVDNLVALANVSLDEVQTLDEVIDFEETFETALDRIEREAPEAFKVIDGRLRALRKAAREAAGMDDEGEIPPRDR